MAKSVVTYEKPLPHIGLSDWYAKQWELQQSADTRKADAFDLRNIGRSVRSETDVKTEWDTRISNNHLTNRITELSGWQDTLERLLNKLLTETRVLRDEKVETENELESLSHPLRVIAECIAMRDCRRGTELTYDEADVELKKELTVLEKIKQMLTERVQAAWERLNYLEELAFKLRLSLEDKAEAINIDKENLNLCYKSSNISFKPNASRIPKNSVSYDAWLDNCRNIKTLTETELNALFDFREALIIMRERTKNDIAAQQDSTDYCLRKRIYQTQKGRNELEWQKQKVQKEMEALQNEIVQLERALVNKTNPLKCAQTRLENRMYRTGFELCIDKVDSGLKNEVQQLQQTMKDLMQTVNNAKASYNSLETLLLRIETNLEDKNHSLATDTMCLDMRAALKARDKNLFANETDRNVILERMENQVQLQT